MNNRRNHDTFVCAQAAYEWLVRRDDPVIPRAAEIGKLLLAEGRVAFQPDGYRMHQALKWLHAQNMIALRHSTLYDEERGHMALRLTQIGKVFKTPGCPFAPPETAKAAG